MNEREEHIIETAMQLFIRYGVKRTSMNDIAIEAGISTQTLYNFFANKDAVLQGTIRLLADRVIAGIQAGVKKTKSLSEQLDVVFEHIAIKHFDLLDTSPNAEEIIAGVNASSQQELAAGAKRNIALISEIIEPYKSEIEKNGLTVEQFADFIQSSATAAKYNAKNREHMLDLLTALRVAALKVTGRA